MATSFRILHVDDDPLMRDLVALSLALDPAFVLLSCESGAETMRVAADWAPDLILCDVMMPDMDGQTLLARLRADPNTAAFPVVFMSARAAGAEEALAHGAAGVIVKPFDPEKLAATVRRLLHTIKLNAAGYDFHQRLRRDAATLAALRRRLADDAPTPELQSFVHKLAGTAGIFKFRTVSARASALEAAIIAARAGTAAPQSLAEPFDALLASIEQA
jgi:two-component system OmpR family response regulator